jgi:hypothetical protein
MSKSKTIVEYVLGCSTYTQEEICLLQRYFQKDWQFAKTGYIYFIDPESGMTTCLSSRILHHPRSKYEFKYLTIETIDHYVNRLQKPKTDLDRGDQQPTSRIQCTSSKVTIASGHLEYGTIDFRWGGKAQIGKANLSF